MVVIEVGVKAGIEHSKVEHGVLTGMPLVSTGELAVGQNVVHREWVGPLLPLGRLGGKARCGRRRWADCSA